MLFDTDDILQFFYYGIPLHFSLSISLYLLLYRLIALCLSTALSPTSNKTHDSVVFVKGFPYVAKIIWCSDFNRNNEGYIDNDQYRAVSGLYGWCAVFILIKVANWLRLWILLK